MINTRRTNQTWHIDQQKALQSDMRCTWSLSAVDFLQARCWKWNGVFTWNELLAGFGFKINILIVGHDNRLNNSLLCLQHRSNRSKKRILVGDVRSFAATQGKVNEVCFKGAVWDRQTDRHKMRRAYVRLWIFHVAQCGFQQTDKIHGSWIVMPH